MQKLVYQKSRKHIHNIYECILRLLDSDICLLSFNDINIKSNIFKKKLANDLVLKHIYKKFDFDLKKQKNIIYNFLISNNINTPICNNILRYISIYLKINILIIYNNLYRFVNNYDKTINTIILIEKDKMKNKLYKCIFNNIDIVNIIKLYNINYEIIIDDNIPFNTQFNKIKKYNLSQIYEICKFYEINLYLDNNSTKIKTKKKLFEELYNILYNI